MVDLLRGIIQDKETIIEEKTKIINLLQDKLKYYEENMKQQVHEFVPNSYANIVQGVPKQEKQSYASIIVKSNTESNATLIKNEIIKQVNPAELKIGIQNVRTTQKGMVIIKCSSKQDTEMLEKAMKVKLEDKYTVEWSKMRSPKIKIPNFNEDMTAEEIEKNILDQNQLSGGVKVTYVQKRKPNNQTIFCECSPNAFKILTDLKKIYIGWHRYPVYENLEVPRCFQCQEFFHKKDNCKNKMACAKCGEEHEASNCSKTNSCCINCTNANKKYKTKHNVNHEASDKECPTRKYHLQVLRRKTEYQV